MSSGNSESQFDEEGISNCQRHRSHQPDGQGQADRGAVREKMQMDTEKGENSTGEEGKEAGPDDSPRFPMTTLIAPYLRGVIEAFVNPVAHEYPIRQRRRHAARQYCHAEARPACVHIQASLT